MSVSVHAEEPSELLIILNDTETAGNVVITSILEPAGLAIASVERFFRRAGAFVCCRAPRPTIQRYSFLDVINAQLIDKTVVIDVADPKKGLKRIQGRIEPQSLENATRWVYRLFSLAYKDALPRKRLKIVINPFSGTGQSRSLWRKRFKPFFEAAQCHLDVSCKHAQLSWCQSILQQATVVTERLGHAKEVARDLDLTAYDAVVCMSGDGIVHEILNGFASRSDALRALRMPIAMIPAGSGNALATCILGPVHVLSPQQTALAIIKGRPMPMDILSVTQGDARYYSFLSQAFGLMADVDVGTDHLRWLGSARFIYAYLNGAIAQRRYACELSVRIVETDKAAIRATCKRRKGAESLDAQSCQTDVDKDVDLSMPPLRFGTVNDPLPTLEEGSRWTTFTHPVSSIYVGSLPYMATDLLQFPAACSDGLMDLVIQPVVGRVAMLAAVDGSERGKQFELDSLRYYKIEAYRLTPHGIIGDSNRSKWLAIDGEVKPYESFQVEAHKGLARVLTTSDDWYLPDEWTSP